MSLGLLHAREWAGYRSHWLCFLRVKEVDGDRKKRQYGQHSICVSRLEVVRKERTADTAAAVPASPLYLSVLLRNEGEVLLMV